MNAYNAATASVCLVVGMKAILYPLHCKFSLPMGLSSVTSAVSISPSYDDIVQGLYGGGVTNKDLTMKLAMKLSHLQKLFHHQSRNLTCHCPGAWRLLVSLVCSFPAPITCMCRWHAMAN